MGCKNCKGLVTERGGKLHCKTCGWFEVDNDRNWQPCEPPSIESEDNNDIEICSDAGDTGTATPLKSQPEPEEKPAEESGGVHSDQDEDDRTSLIRISLI